ncbi:hypothetical protein ACFYW6_38605 [Streptomyces sp. NPDC002659]|uniref:hypothetical protein n=1 Tax=Streptomyces sp. NPDC002659 TaxID=3364656 RepID=UPI0036B3A788
MVRGKEVGRTDVPIQLPDRRGGLTSCPAAREDHDAVAALIDADWLPGQLPARQSLPSAGVVALRKTHTLAVLDTTRWQERCPAGCGPAMRRGDRRLHGREDFEVIATLIALAPAHLGMRPLYACTGPATATGIPALPPPAP